MPTKTTPPECHVNSCLTRGRAQFATSWRRWVSQWTQTEWIKLAEALHGAKLLHSSQYAAFSTGALTEPGPKGFVAAGYLNCALARSERHPKHLIEVCPDIGVPNVMPPDLKPLWWGRLPLVDAEGYALGPSGLFMAFCGLRALRGPIERTIPPEAAEAASRALGAALRAHLMRKGRDFVAELDNHAIDSPIAEDILLGNRVDAPQLQQGIPQLANAMGLQEDDLWRTIETLLE